MDWATAGRVASLTGAVKVETPGTQNPRFTRSDFEPRFNDAFGYSLE